MIRKLAKKHLCTPIQKFKKHFEQDGAFHRLICFLESRVIVGSPWVGIWHWKHKKASGQIVWEGFSYNAAALVDGGEKAILDLFFRGQNVPAGFELGLFNDTVAETDIPTDLLSEPSTNGYARQALARDTTDFPTFALDGGDWKVTSKTVTFNATGGSWGPVNVMCLITTDGTPRLIAYADLSSSRTLLDTESLDASIAIKLQ